MVEPQLPIRILSGELPLDGPALAVARVLPLLYFALQRLLIGNPAAQTLPSEYPDFDLRHVEPAGVFGGVVNPRYTTSAGATV